MLHAVIKKVQRSVRESPQGPKAYCHRTPGHSIVAVAADGQVGVDALPAPTAGPLLTNQPCHLHALGEIPLGVDLGNVGRAVAEHHLRRLQAELFADLGGCGVT